MTLKEVLDDLAAKSPEEIRAALLRGGATHYCDPYDCHIARYLKSAGFTEVVVDPCWVSGVNGSRQAVELPLNIDKVAVSL